MINLKQLEIAAGSEEGARTLFEDMLSQLLKVKYPDAHRIRPSRGDWGIDIIHGELSSGTCVIWQAKYFMHGIGDSQRRNILDSFNTVIKASKTHDFKVNVWYLCVPCDLSTEEHKWWEKWSKSESKSTSIRIELMDRGSIIEMLNKKDAEEIRLGFFGESQAMLKYFLQMLRGDVERDIQQLPSESLYEDSLFIKKLQAAKITEMYSAKSQFFNAELLVREIKDKGDEAELGEIISFYEKLRSMWESRYNEACYNQDFESISKVYGNLLKAIEDHDQDSLKSRKTKASFVHKQGFVQQLANECKVGWSKDFKKLDQGGKTDG